MSILIFSSDESFGDFLSQSLRESGLQTHCALSFSDAELKLYKSEPEIAIFIDLESSELRKIGRAVGEGCSVLVIGDVNQRNIVQAHWRFLSTQSSVTAVLAEITDFFTDVDELSFAMPYEESSCSLEEHFSTSASVDALSSNVVEQCVGRKKIATFGLTRAERDFLGNEFDIVGEEETPFSDSIVVRPDETQNFLEFLSRSQSVLPTAMVSLGPCVFYELLACTVVELDNSADTKSIASSVFATNRENGPCYDLKFTESERKELESLGCRLGTPSDFGRFGSVHPLEESVSFEPKKPQENTLDLSPKGDDFHKRRCLWLSAARTRNLEYRRVQHLPDLMRGLTQFKSPYLMAVSTQRSDSQRFIANMLRENYPLLVDSKSRLLFLCEFEDLGHLENELKSLRTWTGRDTKGLGWFPRVKTRAYKVAFNTIAPILAGMNDIPAGQSSFEVVNDIQLRIRQ